MKVHMNLGDYLLHFVIFPVTPITIGCLWFVNDRASFLDNGLGIIITSLPLVLFLSGWRRLYNFITKKALIEFNPEGIFCYKLNNAILWKNVTNLVIDDLFIKAPKYYLVVTDNNKKPIKIDLIGTDIYRAKRMRSINNFISEYTSLKISLKSIQKTK